MTTNHLVEKNITVYRGTQLDEIFGKPTGAVKSWGWVKLEDLAKTLNSDPIDLLGKYDVLSKDYYDPEDEEKIQLSYVNSEGFFREACNFTEWGRVEMVPAGWANDVLKAVEAGVDYFVAYTTEIVHDWEEEDPDHNCWNSPYHHYIGWVLVFAYKENGMPVAKS